MRISDLSSDVCSSDLQDRRYPEAPSKFLPKAKEVWRNTPLAVQQEVDRIVREHETATQQHREELEHYESVRHFDELARQNRRDLRQLLMQVNEMDDDSEERSRGKECVRTGRSE